MTMTAAQQRAMTLGRELDAVNGQRARAAAFLRSPVLARCPDVAARHLCNIAVLDERRRQLRGLLLDQLENTAPKHAAR